MTTDTDSGGLFALRLTEAGLAWYGPGDGDRPRPLSDPEVAAQLRAALAQRRGDICFAVPGADVRLIPLEVSAEERKHIGKSLPFTLEEELAEDIDELHFASRPIGKLGLSVAVCAQRNMAEWQSQLEEYPGLRRWVPEPLLLPWQAGEWCMVVEDEQALVRHGESEGFTLERTLLPAALESLAGSAHKPRAIVVYGSDQTADLALLPEGLRELAQWRQGGLGAATLLGGSGDPPVNLLQGNYAPRLPLERWWRLWRPVAAMLAIAFALQLLATWADYRRLDQQNLALRSAIEQSYRKANPRGNAPEPEKQLQRQLAGLRGSGGGSGFVQLVEQVGAVLAQRPGTVIASINYNDRAGEMRMNIVAADFGAVEAIREGITAAGLEAEMESSNTQGDKVRARIRVGEPS